MKTKEKETSYQILEDFCNKNYLCLLIEYGNCQDYIVTISYEGIPIYRASSEDSINEALDEVIEGTKLYPLESILNKRMK